VEAGLVSGDKIDVWKKVADQLAELLRREPLLGPSPSGPQLSNISDRNPFFTGREQFLGELREALANRGRAALSGLGGIGKTQTAVEYAHQHSVEYAYAFGLPPLLKRTGRKEHSRAAAKCCIRTHGRTRLPAARTRTGGCIHRRKSLTFSRLLEKLRQAQVGAPR
jgi:hypothetical protein